MVTKYAFFPADNAQNQIKREKEYDDKRVVRPLSTFDRESPNRNKFIQGFHPGKSPMGNISCYTPPFKPEIRIFNILSEFSAMCAQAHPGHA